MMRWSNSGARRSEKAKPGRGRQESPGTASRPGGLRTLLILASARARCKPVPSGTDRGGRPRASSWMRRSDVFSNPTNPLSRPRFSIPESPCGSSAPDRACILLGRQGNGRPRRGPVPSGRCGARLRDSSGRAFASSRPRERPGSAGTRSGSGRRLSTTRSPPTAISSFRNPTLVRSSRCRDADRSRGRCSSLRIDAPRRPTCSRRR
jgi:hypothetical protein